jgi:OmpA-OmpF porin, OOP family
VRLFALIFALVISAASSAHASAELDHKRDAILRSVADIANRWPSAKIEVTGHTDSNGDKETNKKLSEQRAHAVMSFLVQSGIAAARVEALGFGDAHPIAPNDTEANRAKNRRIEFRVLAH